MKTGVDPADVRCVGTAFAADGDPVVAFVEVGGGGGLQVARDENQDGDFTDAGELSTIDVVAPGPCAAVAAEGANPMVVVYRDVPGNLRVLADLNDDGDFADAGENTTIGTAPPLDRLWAAYSAAGRLFVATDGPDGTGAELIVFDPTP